jgi:hypothetical protein
MDQDTRRLNHASTTNNRSQPDAAGQNRSSRRRDKAAAPHFAKVPACCARRPAPAGQLKAYDNALNGTHVTEHDLADPDTADTV